MLVVLALVAGAAGLWYYYRGATPVPDENESDEVADGDWLANLHDQNPRVAEEAARQVKELGAEALPDIQAVLREPAASPPVTKAALKAAGILGPAAAPLVAEVAELLPDPAYTAEAAVALSFMGRDAFVPLRRALDSEDPVVRREALRSIGKLRERAPLDARAVVPLLVAGLSDRDPGVRTVAATYLGIVGEHPDAAVPALINALKDETPEVRSAAASALGSFPSAAATAIPALRRATGDKDADVAREAGVSLVKLQSGGSK